MVATGDTVLAQLELGDVSRSLWEPVLPYLRTALGGDDEPLLTAMEDVARGAGLCQSIPVATLLDAFSDGSEQLRLRMMAGGDPGAEIAGKHLLELEHVALTRIASGYSAGLEETIDRLRRAAADSSPLDLDTGAMKPAELADRLALEVERCQRMDLSLGLVELAFSEADQRHATAACAKRRAMLSDIGACLRENLRRYDSIGLSGEGAFVLVLPDISRRGLTGAAERLRRGLRECAGQQTPPESWLALAHYDFVDVGAAEMLASLRRSLQEARVAHEPLVWI